MVSISWPRDPPASALQSAGITGVSHCTWPWFHFHWLYTQQGSLGHVVVTVLIFGGLNAFFHSGYTNLHSRFAPWPTLTSYLLISPPNRYNVMFHYSFHLNVPDDLWCWAPFHAPVDHSFVFFGETYIHVLCPIFALFFFFFCCWVVWVSHIISRLTSYEICDLQIFSPTL